MNSEMIDYKVPIDIHDDFDMFVGEINDVCKAIQSIVNDASVVNNKNFGLGIQYEKLRRIKEEIREYALLLEIRNKEEL